MKLNGKRETRKGLVLPVIFSVLLILMFMVLAVTSRGTNSLRQASHYNQDDQALYAAEAGLARALAEYQATGDIAEATGTGSTVMTGLIKGTGAKYSVSLYSNDGPGPLKVPTGSSIPEGTALLMAEGESSSGSSKKRSAVLVQKGLGTVQVGSLAAGIEANNSSFLAYDSGRESPGFTGLGVDPNSLLTQEAIIATNVSTGTPVQLTDSDVEGNILVGPGGNPTSQVSAQGDSTTGQIGVLEEKIELPPVVVPSLPGADDTGAPPAPEFYKPTAASNHVSFTQDANGKITVINQCFTCTIQPDGSFRASEAGGKYAEGNLKTGEVTAESGYNVTITDDSFLIDGGYYHGLELTSDGQITVDSASNNGGDKWSEGSRETYPAPDWLTDGFFKNSPPDLHNPGELGTGYFGDVVIDAGKTKLPDSTTVVIRNLEIKDGGQLNLPKDGKDISIYVTGSLKVSGLNAILNEARKAPELKIYYTGTEPVEVSGGASSFLTLVAPDAPINLEGAGSTFYGALATNKELTLNDAEFYYDVATDGVGTGTDGTTMIVLARQRF